MCYINAIQNTFQFSLGRGVPRTAIMQCTKKGNSDPMSLLTKKRRAGDRPAQIAAEDGTPSGAG